MYKYSVLLLLFLYFGPEVQIGYASVREIPSEISTRKVSIYVFKNIPPQTFMGKQRIDYIYDAPQKRYIGYYK